MSHHNSSVEAFQKEKQTPNLISSREGNWEVYIQGNGIISQWQSPRSPLQSLLVLPYAVKEPEAALATSAGMRVKTPPQVPVKHSNPEFAPLLGVRTLHIFLLI